MPGQPPGPAGFQKGRGGFLGDGRVLQPRFQGEAGPAASVPGGACLLCLTDFWLHQSRLGSRLFLAAQRHLCGCSGSRARGSLLAVLALVPPPGMEPEASALEVQNQPLGHLEVSPSRNFLRSLFSGCSGSLADCGSGQALRILPRYF